MKIFKSLVMCLSVFLLTSCSLHIPDFLPNINSSSQQDSTLTQDTDIALQKVELQDSNNNIYTPGDDIKLDAGSDYILTYRLSNPNRNLLLTFSIDGKEYSTLNEEVSIAFTYFAVKLKVPDNKLSVNHSLDFVTYATPDGDEKYNNISHEKFDIFYNIDEKTLPPLLDFMVFDNVTGSGATIHYRLIDYNNVIKKSHIILKSPYPNEEDIVSDDFLNKLDNIWTVDNLVPNTTYVVNMTCSYLNHGEMIEKTFDYKGEFKTLPTTTVTSIEWTASHATLILSYGKDENVVDVIVTTEYGQKIPSASFNVHENKVFVYGLLRGRLNKIKLIINCGWNNKNYELIVDADVNYSEPIYYIETTQLSNKEMVIDLIFEYTYSNITSKQVTIYNSKGDKVLEKFLENENQFKFSFCVLNEKYKIEAIVKYQDRKGEIKENIQTKNLTFFGTEPVPVLDIIENQNHHIKYRVRLTKNGYETINHSYYVKLVEFDYYNNTVLDYSHNQEDTLYFGDITPDPNKNYGIIFSITYSGYDGHSKKVESEVEVNPH